MIRINLLTSFSSAGGNADSGMLSSEEEERKRVIVAVLMRVLVLSIGPVALYIYENQNIPALQAELADATNKYNELKTFNDSKQGLAQEIKKYEEEQAKFIAQSDFINKISNDKVNEYKLFQHIKESTPESVWINRIELNDNILKISAESDESQEIEKFIQRLSNADFISNMVPTSQNVKPDFNGLGITTTVFTVEAKLNQGVSP
jgi:type IV pilus assembly protein PilN